MESDICKECNEERGKHEEDLAKIRELAANPKGGYYELTTCGTFKLDRKATWRADQDRKRLGKLHSRRERFERRLGGR